MRDQLIDRAKSIPDREERRNSTVPAGQSYEGGTFSSASVLANEDAPIDEFQTKPNRNGASATQKRGGLSGQQLQKRLDELESEIHTLESQLDDLTGQIGAASAEGDTVRVRQLGEQYAQTEAELHTTMETWAALAE